MSKQTQNELNHIDQLDDLAESIIGQLFRCTTGQSASFLIPYNSASQRLNGGWNRECAKERVINSIREWAIQRARSRAAMGNELQ
jgi:hypothetical protein